MLKNLSRILLVIALVAVLGISSHPLPVLAAYSCGNPSTNHCYGVNQWRGAVSGTHTYMGVGAEFRDMQPNQNVDVTWDAYELSGCLNCKEYLGKYNVDAYDNFTSYRP